MEAAWNPQDPLGVPIAPNPTPDEELKPLVLWVASRMVDRDPTGEALQLSN